MKVMLVACLFACIAFSSVQSASFYLRNGREVVIPVENGELIRAEIVSELRKEAVQVAAEEVNPIVDTIVRDEVLVPVEALRLVEPTVEVQEPVAIADTEVIVPVVSALRSAAAEVVAVPEAIVAVSNVAEKESVPATRVAAILEEAADVPAAIPVNTVAEKVESAPAVEAIAVKAVVLDDEAAPAVVADDAAERQTDGAPARPSLIQAAQNTITNLLTNNPIANAIQAIRNPQSDTETPVVANADTAAAAAAQTPDSEATDAGAAAPAAPAAPAAATSRPPRPSLINQFQSNLAQFQSQVQSTIQGITGGAASSPAAGAATNAGENRPNVFAQIQHNLSQAINRPLAIFRPQQQQQQDAVTEQKESVDSVVAPVADAIVPIVNEKVELVDNKLDAAKKSE